MNNMDNHSNMMNQDNYYQPANCRMSAAQQMFVKNHPQNFNINYENDRWTCNTNGTTTMTGGMQQSGLNTPHSTWSPTANNMTNTSQNNNSMMVRPPMNNNSSSGTISLTPETLTNTSFLPAYLSQYIGHWIRAEFFIGEAVEQRVGVLHEVGASYFIIEAIEPQTLIVCDMFSVRFVTIVLDDDFSRLMKF